MYNCDICLELSENVEADVTLHFVVSSPGVPSDYFTPGEGPEFEVDDIDVNVLYGKGWERTGVELDEGGWYSEVRERCFDALENYPELYETQLDVYEHSY